MTFKKPVIGYTSIPPIPPRESAMVSRLPWYLAITNLALGVPVVVCDLIWVVLTHRPTDQFDLLQLFLIILNFPSSLPASEMAGYIAQSFKAVRNSGVTALIIAFVFLVCYGFVQYYCIGLILRSIIRSLPGTRKRI